VLLWSLLRIFCALRSRRLTTNNILASFTNDTAFKDYYVHSLCALSASEVCSVYYHTSRIGYYCSRNNMAEGLSRHRHKHTHAVVTRPHNMTSPQQTCIHAAATPSHNNLNATDTHTCSSHQTAQHNLTPTDTHTRNRQTADSIT